MKLGNARVSGDAYSLNPLQELGVMKLWPWEAPPLLAWQGHLRTVAHKCLLDHVQRVHFI